MKISLQIYREQILYHPTRLKLEAGLEHLNSIKVSLGEETLRVEMLLLDSNTTKKYDDLKSLANSGLKLTEKQE